MKRNRSAGIVIKDDKVLVMHRINRGDEYWVFPGGGQEDGETSEQTAVREIDEETTIKVKVGRPVYHITWDTGEENFFYLCDYISGEPKLRSDSEEIHQMKSGKQVYEPMWIEISKLSELKLYQLEVRDLFLRDYKSGFLEHMQELFIKLAERRHK
ncbi:MAG: NUDIX domain-containing protein [Candidatus Paceibacterota bacterium]|jgi:8-oxo-dGTP pyrophosphatase MutT (NUDIX family)